MALEQVGRYRVTGRAQPGKGCLRYPATDTLLGREVILRTFPASLCEDAQVRAHFLAQSKHLARLRHPNIAALLDVVEQDGRVFQVLPRESGRGLACLVRRRHPQEVSWALRLGAGLCDGLSYVHAEGVVHGRISPATVSLREDDDPVLHGFETETSSAADPLLQVVLVVENARFLAPEVVRKERVDARTDLWSLGALLFHLLTGRYPHEGRDAVAVMDHTASDRPCLPVSAAREDLPARVCALVDRLLRKDSASRPATAEEVREEIAAIVGGVEEVSPAERTVQLFGAGKGGLRRYAIRERIGSGAYGVVFRALERDTRLTVAVKLLRPDLTDDPAAGARFRREAEAARGLSHPNVVRVLDAGRDGDAWYVVMELIDGPSLAERLRAGGAMPWAEASRIGAGILDGLSAAHARSVVHRDLKPANILLRVDGSPVIVDFGMAHLADETRLTRAGDILGTPAYMAPEQMEGKPADPRADLYAVGAMLYEMLCGVPPFQAETLPDLIRRVREDPPRSLRDRGVKAADGMEGLVLGLLAKDPARRPGPAARIAESLRALRP